MKEIPTDQWKITDPVFDRLLAERFGDLLQQAATGELFAWRRTARGRLAEIVVLDQFSRNIYRASPQAFAQDVTALVLAQEAVARGTLDELNARERHFLLMPYMHSESRAIHEQAEALFKQYVPESYEFEIRHKVIIDRFGRYPHRNRVLGRPSTEEEAQFLTLPGSGF